MNICVASEQFISPACANRLPPHRLDPYRTSSMSTTSIALITGGSRGLGRNAALKLAEKGTDVIITYHSNREAADQVVAGIKQLGRRAAALQLDAGDIKSFDGFVGQLRAALAQVFGAERFNFL